MSEKHSEQFIREVAGAGDETVPKSEKPKREVVWSPEATAKGRELAEEISRLYARAKGLEEKGDLSEIRNTYAEINSLVSKLEALKEKETPKVISVKTPEGKEISFDLREIRENSLAFYRAHNLEEFADALPKEIRLSPESEARLREAMEAGFDRAVLLPNPELQTQTTDKLFDEMATKPVAGLPDTEQYTAPYITDPVKEKKVTNQNRPLLKAYLLLYQSGAIPEETKGKTFPEAEQELDKLFGKDKWNGLTLEEYLILQRQECEERQDHEFDVWPVDPNKKSEWTWLLDSRVPSGCVHASWFPRNRQVSVHWSEPKHSLSLLGARPAVVVPLEI